MYAMKSKTLSLGIALAFTLLCTACGGQKNDQAGSSDSTQMGAIALPELAEGDEVVFENEDMRIVKGETIETEGGVYNIIEVQPKRSDIKNFKVEGTVLDFEGVVGHTLLTSEGTDVVGALYLHDLTTGKEVMPIDLPFDSSLGVEVADDNMFFFYTNDSEFPTMSWNERKGVWVDQNDVYDFLRNNQLKEMQEKVKEYIFDGFTLRALQMVEVKINERLVNPLSEYKWSPIE
ncbi:hypothetical protein POREN0001_0981 [Porphyromonas endodontalis ATCC 35406]|uniref:Lipoprotein n=2 Tax=Porphyromonas endodontalis TaxID=28124 RepID=C3J941_POREA|nr:hypothetical protein POREN0001_0981 [Porphyromonas endodontalis ATCC 35406]SUB76564.1 Uncharacterised protein [Porphyromonas endodontalis]